MRAFSHSRPLFAAGVTILPGLAWACPACVGRAQDPAMLWGLAALGVLPLVLGGLGVILARRVGSEHSESSSNAERQ